MDSLGSKGEHRISEWLTNKGYLILERNWRIRTGEIDIIALDKSKNIIKNRTIRFRSYYQQKKTREDYKNR